MVFDVANVSGGGESILRQYYLDSISSKEDEWVYVTSNVGLQETENVQVVRYPKAARSAIYRLIFDYITAPYIVIKTKPDRILSLQNLDVPWVSLPQTIYLHQSLPFSKVPIRFSQNKRLWFYQNVYKYRIRHMLYRADKVIVQTKWMKDGCLQLADIREEKVEIIPPNVLFSEGVFYIGDNRPDFVYPANEHFYKNHRVIIDAAHLLKSDSICNYTIAFTISGDENENVRQIRAETIKAGLPISFIGAVPYSTVVNYYRTCILLFPSYIESFGLPLLEARLAGCPIIAADTPFAREILDSYPKSNLFQYNDAKALYSLMKDVIVSSKQVPEVML